MLTRKETDRLLEKYSQSKNIQISLLEAEQRESQLAEGISFGPDLKLMARINTETGLWDALLESSIGDVLYSAIDDRLRLIKVQSFPAKERIVNKEQYSEIELEKICFMHKKEFIIDMGDIRSITKAKHFFKDDYVLSNIILHDDPQKHTAADFFIVHLREYHSLFKMHNHYFSFLWKDTNFNSASMICNKMRELGYLRDA